MKLYFEAFKIETTPVGTGEVLKLQVQVASKDEAIALKSQHPGYDKYRLHCCKHDENSQCEVEEI